LKGQPLYDFAGDAAIGDTKGDGIGGNWHVLRGTPAASGAASKSGYSAYSC